MHQRIGILAMIVAVAAAGCGGGGGGTASFTPGGGTTTTQSSGNIPASDTVAGSGAWVDASSHRTLYYLDVDTATGGTCTAGCLNVWPVEKPSSGAAGSGNMTLITRSDGTGQQWAYQGHPLYMYAGDSGADQANGEGIPDFGGHWHVARPSATTPAPGGTPSPCTGIYC